MTNIEDCVALIVDDEQSDLDTIRRILERRERFTIFTATDFDQAITVFDNCGRKVDLAILDVALPGKNGVELAKHLLKLKPDIRVLFVSGHVGAAVIRFYGIDANDEHFLRKPFDGEALARRIDEVLASSERLRLRESAAGAAGARTSE